MILPFRKENAEHIFILQADPAYRYAFRNLERMLTIEECENLPRVMNAEILCYYYGDEKKFGGFTIVIHHFHKVYEMGFLILKEIQNQGHALIMCSEVQFYLKQKTGARKIIGHVLETDSRTRAICSENGFQEKCVLEEHSFVDGEFVNEILISKTL